MREKEEEGENMCQVIVLTAHYYESTPSKQPYNPNKETNTNQSEEYHRSFHKYFGQFGSRINWLSEQRGIP